MVRNIIRHMGYEVSKLGEVDLLEALIFKKIIKVSFLFKLELMTVRGLILF